MDLSREDILRCARHRVKTGIETEVPDTLLFEFTIDILKVIQGSLFRVIFIAVRNQLRDKFLGDDYVN